MKRDAYLSNEDVTDFTKWASHLVRSEWRLEHSWQNKGPDFRCHTLYEAFQRYLWPNSVNGDRFTDTVGKFDRFRQILHESLPIATSEDQSRFITNARAVARWGGINLILKDWALMRPSQLQAQIDDIKNRLDPVNADTDELRGFKYMGSGYSKIYAALIPGLLIYDSRVACALACLVRLYCRGAGLRTVPPLLNLGVPQGRGNPGGRCKEPQIYYSQEAKYARANLQFAWLMQALVADPGDFAAVPETQRVDALQSALFMLGYARLDDDAIVKSR